MSRTVSVARPPSYLDFWNNDPSMFRGSDRTIPVKHATCEHPRNRSQYKSYNTISMFDHCNSNIIRILLILSKYLIKYTIIHQCCTQLRPIDVFKSVATYLIASLLIISMTIF